MAKKILMDPIIEERWHKGSRREERFWRGKLPKIIASFNHEFQLLPYFKDLIGDKKEVDILDVGCGAIATIGSTWPGVKVNLTSADFMIDLYDELWKESGVKRLLPIEKQDMQHLTYKDNSFDIVHCVNALDHTINPHFAIQEMVRVCKPGGYVYLRHMEKVGWVCRYTGLHQWNIQDFGDDDCIFWNRYEEFLLSEYVPGFKTEKRRELPTESRRIISIYKKP